MTVDELCLNQPGEFKEFMQYCRGLSFTADPDYTYIVHLFEGCMERNHFDTKTPDFIWNKNRLFLEKEALKQNMMRVISKPTGKDKKDDGDSDVAAKEEEEDQGKEQM